MIKNFRAFSLGALVLVCAVALAQEALTLKFSPKVGDTFKYKLTGSLTVGGATADLSGDIEDKVTKADDSGYTIESTQKNIKVSVNGSEMPPQPDATDTTVSKPNGEIVDLTADHVDGDTWRVAELNNFIYPDKPVKVGDEWTSTVVADSKKGTVAATATYKVDSLEKVGSHDTAKIKVSYKETEGATPATSEGYEWVDIKDGSMVKDTSTWTNVPISGMPINGTVTVERVD